MAYGVPTDPVGGTVITVAFCVANILDPIRWLRLLTGNADPPGSAYVVVSTSTSGTSWQKIPTDALADGAVTGAKIANGAVDTQHLAAEAVTADAINPGAVGTNQIANLSVTNGKLALNAVDRDRIADGEVIASKLANNAVTTTAILDSAVATVKLADGAVTEPKLDADNSPTDAYILSYVGSSGRLRWIATGTGVPSGAVVWFETLAELTAAGAGWSRYTAADGRLLIGAGTTFSQTFTEATDYGSAWSHTHTGLSLSVSGSATGGAEDQTGTPTEENGLAAAGGVNLPTTGHRHSLDGVSFAVSGTATGDSSAATWLPPMRAGVWGRAA